MEKLSFLRLLNQLCKFKKVSITTFLKKCNSYFPFSFFLSFFFFFPFMATFVAYGNSSGFGVELEQLPAYARAIATPDLSCICNLCCCLQQRQILKPLSEAGDQTHIFMDTTWFLICWATRELLEILFLTPQC